MRGDGRFTQNDLSVTQSNHVVPFSQTKNFMRSLELIFKDQQLNVKPSTTYLRVPSDKESHVRLSDLSK